MSELLAIDPSIVSVGPALFRDERLVACGRITDPHPPSGRAARALSMAERVVQWLCEHTTSSEITLVVEWQQVYRATKSKGDPNDLIGMGFVSGAIAGLLSTPVAVLEYTPAEWIGQLPKSTRHREAFTSPRGRLIMSRLSPAERALVPRYHDSVDAVGLGLHALGRLILHLYPGCTE